MKRCSRCKIRKSLSEFTKSKSRGDGLSCYCSECSIIKKHQSKTNNIHTYFVDIIRNARSSSAKRGIGEFEIDVEYLMGLHSDQHGLCAISGIKMTHISGKGKVATNISIDRIDSSKGYINGNIQLLCLAANMMKLNMSEEELDIFLRTLSISVCRKNGLMGQCREQT